MAIVVRNRVGYLGLKILYKEANAIGKGMNLSVPSIPEMSRYSGRLGSYALVRQPV